MCQVAYQTKNVKLSVSTPNATSITLSRCELDAAANANIINVNKRNINVLKCSENTSISWLVIAA